MKTKHPHADQAIRLADLTPRVPRAYITGRLNEPGACPRSLYVLACVLRAARQSDQLQPRALGAVVNH